MEECWDYLLPACTAITKSQNTKISNSSLVIYPRKHGLQDYLLPYVQWQHYNLQR
jgi:hypothetical protein